MKKILLFFLPILLLAEAHIFVLHRIDDFRHPYTNTSSKELKRYFDYLKQNNYKVVKLSTLIKMIKEIFIQEKRPHESGVKHVSGYAHYTDDISEPEGTLYGAIGWAKKSHAIIKKIDLHGFSLENANKVIEEFIAQSFEEGVNKIIVITGKGLRSKNDENPYISKNLSILKYSVPEFIKSNINLMKIIKNINEADIEDGGKGAFYIYLKNFKE